MARQSINTASRGDSVKQGFDKSEANFVELYAGVQTLSQNIQTGATYTLVLSDAGKVIEMNSASANTVTVPHNSSVAFPIGTVLDVYQMGLGITSVAPGANVILRNAGQLRQQYSSASLRKRATNEWVLSGDLL